MHEADSKPPAATGKVEGDRIFGSFLNEHPEFWIIIESLIKEASQFWTRELKLIDMAEDIAQELKLNLINGTGGFNLLGLPAEKKRLYIFGAAENQCLRELQKRKRLKVIISDKTFDISASFTIMPEQSAVKQEQLRKARKYLKRLKALERKVYVMVRVDQMSLRDVAEKLALSHSYVRDLRDKAIGKIERYKHNDRE